MFEKLKGMGCGRGSTRNKIRELDLHRRWLLVDPGYRNADRLEPKEMGRGAGGEKDWPRSQLPPHGISACILFKAEPGVIMTMMEPGRRES